MDDPLTNVLLGGVIFLSVLVVRVERTCPLLEGVSEVVSAEPSIVSHGA